MPEPLPRALSSPQGNGNVTRAAMFVIAEGNPQQHGGTALMTQRVACGNDKRRRFYFLSKH